MERSRGWNSTEGGATGWGRVAGRFAKPRSQVRCGQDLCRVHSSPGGAKTKGQALALLQSQGGGLEGSLSALHPGITGWPLQGVRDASRKMVSQPAGCKVILHLCGILSHGQSTPLPPSGTRSVERRRPAFCPKPLGREEFEP